MQDYILSLDLGTSSVRSILFDKEGSLIFFSQETLRQTYPNASWVEENPEQIWELTKKTLSACAHFASSHQKTISCLGITNQRETTIVWDKKTDKPIYPAIVWQDRRTASRCQELKDQGLEPLINSKTGLLLDPYFSATKLEWILKEVHKKKDNESMIDLAFGTVDSWILWKLTGGKVHGTDVTNASRTMLFNILILDWDEELLNLFSIPKAMLPKVFPSSFKVAEIETIPSLKNIPITGIAGDQHAALFGQKCLKKGDTKCTYGTGCFILMNTGEKPVFSKHRLLTTIAFQVGSKTYYALEGSVFMGGALVKWLKETLQFIKTSDESEFLALQCKDSDDVYFVPAFSGLGAPYWDPYAKGTLLGLTQRTTKAHIMRAALESIAFQVCDVLDVMMKDSGCQIDDLRVDGGASNNGLLMQFQSNLTQRPLHLPKIHEVTAFGVAMLAAIGANLLTLETIKHSNSARETIQPKLSEEEILIRKKRWKEAVSCCQKWSSFQKQRMSQ